MKQFLIYKITNRRNNKSYIGFTSKTLDKRWKEHVYSAIQRNSRFRLHAAIRKHGVESFELSVLEETSNGNHALNVLEPQYIAEYDTMANGYNTLPGGSKKGWAHSEEAKEKMSLNNHWQGKSSSGNLNPMFGRHHTEEVKKIQSLRRKGKASYTKKFVIVDPAGQIHNIENLAEYCRNHDIDKNCMSEVASENHFHHQGYLCFHAGVLKSVIHKKRKELLKRADPIYLGTIRSAKSYLVYFPDGTEEKIINMAAFCRKYDLHKGNMSSVASGRLKQYKGFRCTLLNTIE